MLRAARTLAVLATIANALSCKTLEDPHPPQATLNVDITDSAVGTQLAPLPSPQVVSLRVEALTVCGVPGYPCDPDPNAPSAIEPYSFLYTGPCLYQLNALAPVLFGSFCGTSGLTLPPGTDVLSAKLRIVISRLELRAGARPDLSSSGDPDGDGVPNNLDNCPIVYNPDQANVNEISETFKVGDACSTLDANNQPVVADQDLDGVDDSIDNCFWYPNPLLPGETRPTDVNRDGIGDTCERIAPVALLPSGRLTLECDNVVFTAKPSTITFFRIDLGRPGVLTCDAGFTGCTIDPSAVKLSLLGETTTFSCKSVE